MYILSTSLDPKVAAAITRYCHQHDLTISYGRQAAFGRHDPGYRIDIDSASSHATCILLGHDIAFEIHDESV